VPLTPCTHPYNSAAELKIECMEDLDSIFASCQLKYSA
jgi:hypothetical protein